METLTPTNLPDPVSSPNLSETPLLYCSVPASAADDGPGPGPETVVAYREYGGVKYSMDLASINCLQPKKCINDTVVDYGLALVLQECGVNPAEVVYLPAVTFPMIKKPLEAPFPPSTLRGLYRNLTRFVGNPLDLKYIVLPVIRKEHWSLAIICSPFPSPDIVASVDNQVAECSLFSDTHKSVILRRSYISWWNAKGRPPMILILDSNRFKTETYTKFLDKTALFIKHALLSLHMKFWAETQRPRLLFSDANHLIPHRIMEMPQQNNTYDCGVFMMTYTKLWFEQLSNCNDDYDWLSQQNFHQFFDLSVHKDHTNMRAKLMHTIAQDCRTQFPQYLGQVLKSVPPDKARPSTSNSNETEPEP